MTLANAPPLDKDPGYDFDANLDDEFDEQNDTLAKRKGHSCFREISRAKKEYKAKIQEMLARHKQERADWERMLKEQTRALHENYEREYTRVSKNYQTQIDQMREVYTSQITQILQVLKNAVDSQVVAAKENAARQAADPRQVDELKKWMVGEFTDKIAKYKEIMASIDADEANKEALASGQGIEIESRTKRSGPRKTNLRDDVQNLTDTDTSSENRKEFIRRVHERQQRVELEDIEDAPRQPERRPVTSKKDGGLAGFFRAFGTT